MIEVSEREAPEGPSEEGPRTLDERLDELSSKVDRLLSLFEPGAAEGAPASLPIAASRRASEKAGGDANKLLTSPRACASPPRAPPSPPANRSLQVEGQSMRVEGELGARRVEDDPMEA